MSDPTHEVGLTASEMQLIMYALNGFYRGKKDITEAQITELRIVISKVWKVLLDVSMVPITTMTIDEILNGQRADTNQKYNS